nr:MAG TPA: hypothetical protein [Bacteriophage sp.]
MENIIIAGIELPRTRKFEIGGEVEAKEATMASGRIVKDIIGWRLRISATWEWVPAGLFAQLVPIVRSGEFVKIEYPDSSGENATGIFSIEIGNQKIFKFINGEPFWYNIELIATAQEVI